MSDPATLSAIFDLRAALDEVVDNGAAYVDGALTAGFHDLLEAEVIGEEFDTMSGYAGVAEQEGEVLRIRDGITRYPNLARLRTDLIHRVHADGHGIEGIDRWEPNEADVQRYAAGALGITPHLDRKRYHVLVAVFTLAAAAPFTVCADRSGTIRTRWQAAPCSLVLLRAPGLAGTDDGRPLHTVEGPRTGHRISVSFRMNARAGDVQGGDVA